MRDAGHRTPDIGHRTSDGEKSKNNISTPQGGGHNNYLRSFGEGVDGKEPLNKSKLKLLSLSGVLRLKFMPIIAMCECKPHLQPTQKIQSFVTECKVQIFNP